MIVKIGHVTGWHTVCTVTYLVSHHLLIPPKNACLARSADIIDRVTHSLGRRRALDGYQPLYLCHARTHNHHSLPPLFRTFRPLGRWQSPLLLLLLCQAAFRMCFLPAFRFLKARIHFSFPGCATCILRTQLMHKIPCQRL